MTDNLLYFEVRVLLGCVIVEKCLEVVDEVVSLVGNLQIRHYDVVRSVGPAVFERLVGSVCFTGKVEPLEGEL